MLLVSRLSYIESCQSVRTLRTFWVAILPTTTINSPPAHIRSRIRASGLGRHSTVIRDINAEIRTQEIMLKDKQAIKAKMVEFEKLYHMARSAWTAQDLRSEEHTSIARATCNTIQSSSTMSIWQSLSRYHPNDATKMCS